MNVTVMRRIRFNAGHRLLGHEGKCANFHGHNYVADFHVTADDEGPAQVDEVGRVIDFAELKALLKGWIDEHWDHGFVLSRDDANGIAAIRSVEPTKYFLLPDNPTAENMARYLLETVCPQLLSSYGVEAICVALWETEETCAVVTIPTAENRVGVAALTERLPLESSW